MVSKASVNEHPANWIRLRKAWSSDKILPARVPSANRGGFLIHRYVKVPNAVGPRVHAQRGHGIANQSKTVTTQNLPG